MWGTFGAFQAPDGSYHHYYTARGTDNLLGRRIRLGLLSRGLSNSEEDRRASSAIGHGTDPILIFDTDVLVGIGDNDGSIEMRSPILSDPGDLSGNAATCSLKCDSRRFEPTFPRDTEYRNLRP